MQRAQKIILHFKEAASLVCPTVPGSDESLWRNTSARQFVYRLFTYAEVEWFRHRKSG